VARALEVAIEELTRKLGADPSRWRWDRAHQAVFPHALEWKDARFASDPVPADGDNSTPCVGRSALPWSTTFTHAAVFRHVVDLAIADSSIGIVPPGNSGPPTRGHHRDHLARWADHQYVPFLLAWDRIERESEIVLVPPTGASR
jgi:penicillin amidase